MKKRYLKLAKKWFNQIRLIFKFAAICAAVSFIVFLTNLVYCVIGHDEGSQNFLIDKSIHFLIISIIFALIGWSKDIYEIFKGTSVILIFLLVISCSFANKISDSIDRSENQYYTLVSASKMVIDSVHVRKHANIFYGHYKPNTIYWFPGKENFNAGDTIDITFDIFRRIHIKTVKNASY